MEGSSVPMDDDEMQRIQKEIERAKRDKAQADATKAKYEAQHEEAKMKRTKRGEVHDSVKTVVAVGGLLVAAAGLWLKHKSD